MENQAEIRQQRAMNVRIKGHQADNGIVHRSPQPTHHHKLFPLLKELETWLWTGTQNQLWHMHVLAVHKTLSIGTLGFNPCRDNARYWNKEIKIPTYSARVYNPVVKGPMVFFTSILCLCGVRAHIAWCCLLVQIGVEILNTFLHFWRVL